MIKYYCDRCNKEVETLKDLHSIIANKTMLDEYNAHRSNNYHFDKMPFKLELLVCPSCWADIFNFAKTSPIKEK